MLKPSGETAAARLGCGILTGPFIQVTNPGSGYVSTPSVVIDGNGNGMEAEAVIANGSVTQIQITNPGTGYTRGTVELVGGFAYNEQFYLANANDSDGVIQKVTFYQNGVPVNTDFFYPYEFGWSPGPPGYYDLYFEVTDNLSLIHI